MKKNCLKIHFFLLNSNRYLIHKLLVFFFLFFKYINSWVGMSLVARCCEWEKFNEPWSNPPILLLSSLLMTLQFDPNRLFYSFTLA